MTSVSNETATVHLAVNGDRDMPTNLRTELARQAAERMATKFIAANDNTPPKGRTPVYRGGRPAMNWAAKQDRYGAACLWLIARQRLPDSVVVAANDNEPARGGLDVRKNGTARGKSKVKSNLGAYLALPAVLPRLGDGEPQPVQPCGYTRLDILPQNEVDEISYDFVSYGACADAVAVGATFLGAEGGLGTPRPGKSKGSPLKAEEPDFGEPPPEIDYIIELMMACENVSSIGKAFGATGRYQDKKGAALLRRAMAWAKERVAESNFRANVTNCVT
ncbi:hypothetical protein J2046_006789 [Rhizobium petrolearium]|uniref:hypothetical protein n=1 Tax=Neorhizobium petrolearium TaxID=515361 RepID=UPI001AE41180|nr:hypothetical protein [Neorhizobium petrolearium]MBP1848493.1 hypothetical protein [Neorhizobium petrolearium]